MTWLGIDLGDARVGLALSDPELSFSHPIGDIEVHGDSFRGLDDVIDTIARERVDVVVIGLPLQLNGAEGKSAKKARRWAANLKKRLASRDSGTPELEVAPRVDMLDERLTTVAAHRQLFDADLTGRSHRPFVDQQSAVLILQMALDRNRK